MLGQERLCSAPAVPPCFDGTGSVHFFRRVLPLFDNEVSLRLPYWHRRCVGFALQSPFTQTLLLSYTIRSSLKKAVLRYSSFSLVLFIVSCQKIAVNDEFFCICSVKLNLGYLYLHQKCQLRLLFSLIFPHCSLTLDSCFLLY